MVERVADYPRPPRLERSARTVRIELGGQVIAATTAALRVLETHHPPTWYLPPAAFVPGVLRLVAGRSHCEWKGVARYWTLTAGGRVAERAGWSYPDPTPGFAALRDHVAVYADAMDGCFVDGERVRPQPGTFYGGWITDDLVGPFKGMTGTEGW